MKRFIRKLNNNIMKHLCTMCLVLLFIISFDAEAVDNNGSSFITKTEFDNMKTIFQNQLNQFNSNIDNKIDLAIAEYLKGIKTNEPPTDLYIDIKGAIGDDMWFKNVVHTDVIDTGTENITPQLNLLFSRRLRYKYYTNLRTGFKMHPDVDGDGKIYIENNFKNDTNTNVDAGKVLMTMGWRIDMPSRSTSWDSGELAFDVKWPNQFQTSSLGQTANAMYYQASWSKTNNSLTIGSNDVKNVTTISNGGNGSAWVYHIAPNGTKILREYARKIFPVQSIDVDAHTFKNFTNGSGTTYSFNATQAKNWYSTSNGMADNTTIDVSVASLDDYGAVSQGTKVDDSNEDALKTYYKHNLSLMKIANDEDYSAYQWGKNTESVIYCTQDMQKPGIGTQTTISSDETKSKFNSIVYQPGKTILDDTDLSGATIKYFPNTYNPTAYKLSDFSNEYISSSFSEDVRLGGGTPFFRIWYDYQNATVKLKFKLRNANFLPYDPVLDGNIHYMLSDKQFINGEFAPGSRHFADSSVSVGEYVTININDYAGVVWINFYAEQLGYDAAIDDYLITTTL